MSNTSRKHSGTRWAKLMLCIAVPCILSSCSRFGGEREGPPNIVIILMDDSGYGDWGPFNEIAYDTPSIDHMAKEGRRFTQFYVAQPVCTASRAALLTGCYSNRIGMTGALGPASTKRIHESELLISELLKQKNYATGIFGKWHLGDEPEFLPTRHGFDEYFGLPYSNDMWPYHPETDKFPDLPLIEQETVINPKVSAEDQKLLTKQYTERAVKFIHENRDQPFFLYVPHSMPHVPLYTSDAFTGKSGAGVYGDVMMELDWSVGEILTALRKSGVARNTLTILISDNGPWLSYGNHGGSSGGFREGKGTTFDGGVHVSSIMHWPGEISAGSTCDRPVMTIDLLPTIAELTGTELANQPIDGRSIAGLVSGGEATGSAPRPYYFYWGYRLEAVRLGKWKMHLPHNYRVVLEPGMDGMAGKRGQEKIELSLFDLERDPGETTNVANENPDVMKEMMELAEKAKSEIVKREYLQK